MIDFVCAPPALLTRMSTRPSSRSVVSTSCLALLGIRHVGRYGRGRGVRGPRSRPRWRLQRLGAPRREHDVGAVIGEHERGAAADAGTASGDDRDPPVEGESIAHVTAPPLTPMT